MAHVSPLILVARIVGLVLPLSLIAGLALRSVQAGKLALRAGIVWGMVFALGMMILALPGLALAELVHAFGWPIWLVGLRSANPHGFASMVSTAVMLLGAGLTWVALPGLADLEKKWRGDR